MMADLNIKTTMGAKQAFIGKATATLNIEVTMTKRYIWLMKLRYIWAVIRAKSDGSNANT